MSILDNEPVETPPQGEPVETPPQGEPVETPPQGEPGETPPQGEPGETENSEKEDWEKAILEAKPIEDRIEIEIDYGESEAGTPAWYAKREIGIYKKSQADFWDGLKESFPAQARLIEYLNQGGNIEDYNSAKNFDTYSENNIKGDIDLQKQIYHRHLVETGVSEKKAQAMIKASIEADELEDDALKSNEYFNNRNQEEEQKLLNSQKEEETIRNSTIETFKNDYSDIIKTGRVGSLNVDKKIIKELGDAINDNLSYENRKIVYKIEVNKTTLPKLLEQTLFSLKGGDINSLITRNAKTGAVKELKAKLEKPKTSASGGNPNYNDVDWATSLQQKQQKQ